MNDTKWTRGPWEVKEHSTNCDVRAEDLTVVCGVTMRSSAAEEAANARLIAAAPSLYAALRTMLEAFQVTTPKNEAEAMKNINARRIAREALSKAEAGAK